jgi:hypothetical protein
MSGRCKEKRRYHRERRDFNRQVSDRERVHEAIRATCRRSMQAVRHAIEIDCDGGYLSDCAGIADA